MNVLLVMSFKLLHEPPKEELLPALNEAFEHYRSGSVGNPEVYVYFLETWEDVIYEPLPHGI